jgi:hypothetical protein
MLLWNDALVFPLGGEWLAHRLGSAPYDTQTPDIDVELDRLSSTIPQIHIWAPTSRGKIAIDYRNLLRDCGMRRGPSANASGDHLSDPML